MAVVLTGYVAALAVYAALRRSPHRFHWLLPVDGLLPAPATLILNLGFYAYLLWLFIVIVVIARRLQGKERVLVAGWVPDILLSPYQSMVSAPLAVAIQYFKAVGMMVAFVAAVLILVERSAYGNSFRPDGASPE